MFPSIAKEGTRTPKRFPSLPPQGSASTSFATFAKLNMILIETISLQ